MKQPYIVIGKVSLLAVFNFGTLSSDAVGLQRESILRPANYKAKRLYYKEEGYGAAFYTCKLIYKKNTPHYSITTESGRKFSGSRSIFQEFLKALHFDKFKNIDDFFGLTNPNVQKMILDMAAPGKCDSS